jgi:glycosyltransferase involved in cell wall biosynthesis
MASYRGGQFIGEQIESILEQLGPDDELVIVDDASPDNTVSLVSAYDDPRIKLTGSAVNQGYVRSFERAVLASRGRYILLADQDDVWVPGRLDVLLAALESAEVVASNFDVLHGEPRPAIPRLRSRDSSRHLANLLGIMVGYRAYYGCGMGFRREMLNVFAPVPNYLDESHDLWLAICGNAAKSIRHVDGSTLLRRIHDENATPRGWRSLPVILRSRWMLLKCIFEAARRLRRVGGGGSR